MKNYNFLIDGGGVFSRILQCAIIPLADIEFDNVYLIAKPLWINEAIKETIPYINYLYTEQYRILSDYINEDPFERLLNYILDQKSNYSYVDCGLLPAGKMYTRTDRIENSPRLQDYRNVIKKLRFKNEIYNDVNKIFLGIDPKMVLAAHLRIKDVGGHGYDNVTLSQFTDAIDRELKNFNYQKIFIASDNLPAIDHLKQKYGPEMILHHDFDRSAVAKTDFAEWEFRNYFKKKYWHEAMVDCLSLAKCRTFICRVSNFSNAAIVFGRHDEIISL